jgi:cell division protein FtsW (lipid II flippase)
MLLGGSGLLLSLFPAALLKRTPDWEYVWGALAVLVAGRLAVTVYQLSFRRTEPGLVLRLTLVLGLGYLLQRALHWPTAGAPKWEEYAAAFGVLCLTWWGVPLFGALWRRYLGRPLWAWVVPLGLAAALWAFQILHAIRTLATTHAWPQGAGLLTVEPFGFTAPLVILHLVVIGLALILAGRHQRLSELPTSLGIARLTAGLPRGLSMWLRSLSPPPPRYLALPGLAIAATMLMFVTLRENGTSLCLILTALLLVTVISRRWAVGVGFAALGLLLLCTPAVLSKVLPSHSTPLLRSVAFWNPWDLPSMDTARNTEYLLTLPRALKMQAMAGVTGLSPGIAPVTRWVPRVDQDAPVVGATLLFGLLGALAMVAVYLQLLLALLASARDMRWPGPAMVVLGQTVCMAVLAVVGWSGFIRVIPIVGVPWPGYSQSRLEVIVLTLVVGYAGSVLGRQPSVEAPLQAAVPIGRYARRLSYSLAFLFLVPSLVLAWYTLPAAGKVAARPLRAERPQKYDGVWDTEREDRFTNSLRLQLLGGYRVIDRQRRDLMVWGEDGRVASLAPYAWPFTGMGDLLRERYRWADGDVLQTCRDLMAEERDEFGLGLAWHARTRFSPWYEKASPQVVMLTLDAGVQETVARRLLDAVQKHGTPGRGRGTAVVWDIQSGEILGLFFAPRPVFGAADRRDKALRIAQRDLRGRAPYDEVWTNRLYTASRPGSSFKIVTTTAYLLWREQKQRPLEEWELPRLTRAVARSETQTGFFQGLGRQVGSDYLYHVATDATEGFGLAVPSNVAPSDYQRGFRNAGTFRGLDKVSVGMGVAMESVFDQMKVIDCVANHGEYVKPYYLRSIIRGNSVQQVPPAIRGARGARTEQRLPRTVADTMAGVMEEAVLRPDATTHRAFSDLCDGGVAVGAKTGTGDSLFHYAGPSTPPDRRRPRGKAGWVQGNTVWTIAYGRHNDRLVGVVATLEDVPSGHLAAEVAAPLAADLLTSGLRAVGGL